MQCTIGSLWAVRWSLGYYWQFAGGERIKEDFPVSQFRKMVTLMAKEVLLTSEGLEKLEQELEELKTVKRKDIADKIKLAVSFGDLSENSEYDEAKNEQAMIEARIAQLQAMIKNAKVLDLENADRNSVSVGMKVRLKDIDFDEEEIYHIVGSTETDPDNGRISDESPIGKGLLGHKVGEKVSISVPSGAVINYEILEITID